MIKSRMNIAGLSVACLVLLAGCAGFKDARLDPEAMRVKGGRNADRSGDGSSIFDAFKGAKDEVKVNRFLWTATLQVLDFLP
ncbi:MAG: DUF3576 domain-containing protein, partial [Roseovarius sp.]|nr:DUF3576 domain-containing protein [Roseovarius sp.]